MDKDTKRRLDQGERIVEVLKQDKSAPVKVENQVVIIYAVVNDYLKDIPVGRIKEFESELYKYMDSQGSEIISDIAKTKDLSRETEEKLKEALTKFVQDFKASEK